MAVLKLFSHDTLVARVDNLSLREDDIVVLIYRTVRVGFLNTLLKLPQLNYPIVGREKLLIASLRGAKKLNGIYFFIEFQALQVVELRLV